MKQSDIFREHAENCRELAEDAESMPAVRRYYRMAEAWIALAREQDWLDGEVSPLPADRRSPAAPLIAHDSGSPRSPMIFGKVGTFADLARIRAAARPHDRSAPQWKA